uniref:Uncharacterized protein n=1 Tax=Arion vulgaris TaxID=1028688 RepID=A0A0B7B0N8_9EUPU
MVTARDSSWPESLHTYEGRHSSEIRTYWFSIFRFSRYHSGFSPSTQGTYILSEKAQICTDGLQVRFNKKKTPLYHSTSTHLHCNMSDLIGHR